MLSAYIRQSRQWYARQYRVEPVGRTSDSNYEQPYEHQKGKKHPLLAPKSLATPAVKKKNIKSISQYCFKATTGCNLSIWV